MSWIWEWVLGFGAPVGKGVGVSRERGGGDGMAAPGRVSPGAAPSGAGSMCCCPHSGGCRLSPDERTSEVRTLRSEFRR